MLSTLTNYSIKLFILWPEWTSLTVNSSYSLVCSDLDFNEIVRGGILAAAQIRIDPTVGNESSNFNFDTLSASHQTKLPPKRS